MKPKTLGELEADALSYVSSVAMAAARTTSAKRAYEDAVHEERVVTQKLNEAICAIRLAAVLPESKG